MALYGHVRLSLLADAVHLWLHELHSRGVGSSVESPDGPVSWNRLSGSF